MRMDDERMDDDSVVVVQEAEEEEEEEDDYDVVMEDGDYEFDASRFFDFLREEYDWEIEEAERWFEVSGGYEPSPFIVRLNMEKLFPTEAVPNAITPKATGNKKLQSDGRDRVSAPKNNVEGKITRMSQDAAKYKASSSADKPFQPRSSTLMKPTASHLAKQNKLPDDYKRPSLSIRSGRTSSNMSEKSSTSSVRVENLGTKRQKLDTGGYLRKMAHLKHHISFLHKSSKKVTVPKEPELETLLRAQRRSSKSSSVSSDNEKDSKSGSNFKALPLNRKIFQASSLSQSIKSTTPVTQSHMFRLKTMERANHRAAIKASKSKDIDLRASNGATDSKRPNSRETLKFLKQKESLDSEANSSVEKEPELSTSDQLVVLPPIEQFTELSLGSSDGEDISALQSESNSSAEASCVRNSMQSLVNACGDHLRVHEATWSDFNRDLDTR